MENDIIINCDECPDLAAAQELLDLAANKMGAILIICEGIILRTEGTELEGSIAHQVDRITAIVRDYLEQVGEDEIA